MTFRCLHTCTRIHMLHACFHKWTTPSPLRRRPSMAHPSEGSPAATRIASARLCLVTHVHRRLLAPCGIMRCVCDVCLHVFLILAFHSLTVRPCCYSICHTLTAALSLWVHGNQARVCHNFSNSQILIFDFLYSSVRHAMELTVPLYWYSLFILSLFCPQSQTHSASKWKLNEKWKR